MRVYVINKYGKPLMPCKPRKARKLLEAGKAKVVNREPFTIQLLYDSTGYKQPITIGVDTGHNNVGVSVVSETKELNSYEFKLRNDISKKMESRRSYRSNRRSKLRYRKPRFDNRSASTKSGRLAPSVQWKVDAHIRIVDMISNRLPNSTLILETGAFDTQKLSNSNIKGKQYQEGEQFGWSNIREYVLHRDRHKCQAGRNGCSKKLHVHHIVFKSNGGSDKPSNLITLCEKHHKDLHNGKFEITKTNNKSYKSATVMSIVRKSLLEHYVDAEETFGYITKQKRFNLRLEKSHTNDAFVIANGSNQSRSNVQYWGFKKSNNRILQINRNGYKPSIRRKRYSIQPKDIVEFNGKRHIANGVHCKGSRCIIWVDGKKSSKNINYLKTIYNSKTMFIQEVRKQAHSSQPQQADDWVSCDKTL